MKGGWFEMSSSRDLTYGDTTGKAVDFGYDCGLREGKELGAIRAYELLLELDIANSETNEWLKTQIKLLKEKKVGLV